MVEAACYMKDCGHVVDDGEFLDDAVHKMQLHFRDAHPTKWLNAAAFGERVQQYNIGLNDYFEQYYGRGWEGLQHVDLVRAIRDIITPRDGVPKYCSSTIAEGNKWIEDNPAPEVQPGAAPLGQPVDGGIQMPPVNAPAPGPVDPFFWNAGIVENVVGFPVIEEDDEAF